METVDMTARFRWGKLQKSGWGFKGKAGRTEAKAAFVLVVMLAAGWADAGAEEMGEKIRGITVSTHRGGREWGDPEVMGPTFERIEAVGANWVAIHPYARIERDGTVSYRWRRRRGQAEPEPWTGPPPSWTEPIKEAHRRGLKICVKPHLAHWRSFSWRGEISFASEAEWARFWEGYREWILAVAGAAREADMFVVGTELEKTVDHERAWRDLIAEVRDSTGAALTYAANWDGYERVGYWDALDAVGIQAYFPISEADAPTRGDLEAGWRRLAGRLIAYGERTGKPIVLTELGYNRSFVAARRPWEYDTDGPEAEALQILCTQVALEAIEREEAIAGAFLWKWFPEPRAVGRNFQLATDGMRAAIRGVWEAGAGEGD